MVRVEYGGKWRFGEETSNNSNLEKNIKCREMQIPMKAWEKGGTSYSWGLPDL